MDIDIEINNLLIDAINTDLPVILFLGQNFINNVEGKDSVLQLLEKRLNVERSITWSNIAQDINITEEDLKWINERFSRQVLSESIVENFKFPWSAVFTTSIDSRISKYLETHGRHPETLIVRDTNPKKVRSKYSPPIYYLFSKSNEFAEKFHIPFNKQELHKRKKQHTENMLSKLSDTVTSLGLLVIEGFNSNDWLDIDDFLASIPEESAFKILWCGLKEKPESVFFDDFVKKGFILFDSRPLHKILNDLRAESCIEFNDNIIRDDTGVISVSKDKFIEISPSLRLRIEASASIIDDQWTSYIPLPENEEELFRQFHGGSVSLRKHFEGVALEYSIKRDFEDKLKEKAFSFLTKGSKKNPVVILHGQTSTGKSIALARLAIEIRKELKNPVLYATNRVPNLVDIDTFCIEAENQADTSTVIICDANTTQTAYYDLANGLNSRGRKVLVIGTSYSIHDQSENFIHAPSEINKAEISSLKELIKRYMPHSVFLKETASSEKLSKEHILALLYRLLNVSRPSIIEGISLEARSTELILQDRSESVPVSSQITNQLSEQLINAGLFNSKISIFDDSTLKENYDTSVAGKLIDYVMSIGRLNCSIPVNLLIRVLGNKHESLSLDQIYYIFKDLDLFRWHYDNEEETELFIGPRIQLEADLICQSRLADKEKEISYIIDLIEGVRPFTIGKDGELQFLYQLLLQLDGEGMRGEYYAFGYLKIANALTKLREDTKFEDPSLMLRESSFRRAYLKYLDSQGFEDESFDRNVILNQAREAVENALEILNEKQTKTYKFLLVERASIYGYLAMAQIKKNASIEDIWTNYEASKVAVKNAMSGSTGYFPIDVSLWTSVDILKKATLPIEKVAELHSNIYYMLDQVDENELPPSQIVNFQKQKIRASSVLQNKEMETEAIEKLKKINPPSAYYLIARNMCPEIFEIKDKQFDVNSIQKAKKAYTFLMENEQVVMNDERCLSLMIEFLWTSNIGRRIFRGERQPIPIDNTRFLHDLKRILLNLHNVTNGNVRNVFKYLEGVVLWLTDEEIPAKNIWQVLEKETEFEDASRIIKRLFIADNNLMPKKFSGRIDKQLSNNRWSAKVNNINKNITVIESDFSGQSLEIGREITNFAISFNYLGAIADTRIMEIKK